MRRPREVFGQSRYTYCEQLSMLWLGSCLSTCRRFFRVSTVIFPSRLTSSPLLSLLPAIHVPRPSPPRQVGRGSDEHIRAQNQPRDGITSAEAAGASGPIRRTPGDDGRQEARAGLRSTSGKGEHFFCRARYERLMISLSVCRIF